MLIITLVAGVLSWRAAYRTLGIVALPLSIPLFLIMRKRPEDIGLLPDGDRAEPGGSARGERVRWPPGEFDWRLREVVQVPSFWFIVWAEFWRINDSAVTFQLVPFLTDGGMSRSLAAGALEVSVLLGGLSVPLWGYLSDRFTIRRLTIAAVTATSVPTAAFAFIDVPSVGFYVSVVWGIASGRHPCGWVA